MKATLPTLVAGLLAASSALAIDHPGKLLGTHKTYAGEMGAGVATTSPPTIQGQALPELDLPHAVRRLDNLRVEQPLRLRGAKEVSIYARNAPAVVLIVNDDSIGSGALLTADGQIITNWHVVSGKREVGVIFKPVVEGARITSKDLRLARVTKYDEIADLALLQVKGVPSHVRPIQLGAADEIRVGSDVHAIGHPTGETWTYTKGLISQYRKAYQWTSESRRKHVADVIQTQTPINPGNSGGPLIGESGAMIGINSFKAEGEALNFAVSISEVNRFMQRPGNRVAVTAEPRQEARSRAKCEAQELRRGRNKANDADVVWYDLTCDGLWDAFLLLPDDTAEPFSLNIDSKDVGRVDIVVLDFDRDGKWDRSLHDTDGDGEADLVGYHPDGNVKASRFERYVAQR